MPWPTNWKLDIVYLVTAVCASTSSSIQALDRHTSVAAIVTAGELNSVWCGCSRSRQDFVADRCRRFVTWKIMRRKKNGTVQMHSTGAICSMRFHTHDKASSDCKMRLRRAFTYQQALLYSPFHFFREISRAQTITPRWKTFPRL